jgi:D-2-hydroxyacid dehydrogenase (NADP+)
MNVLIRQTEAAYIKQALAPKFPDLNIHAAAMEDEVGDFIEVADILMAKKISDNLIKKASKLQWIQIMISGVDKIVNLPSLRKGVLLTSARGIHGPQMAEMAIFFMMLLIRKISRIIQEKENRIWDRRPSKLLYLKKVGILGLGIIGQAIAKKCKEFGMTVYGIDIVRKKIDSVDKMYGPENLIEVLEAVDFFINVVPFTPETYKMIGAKEISAMKPTAYFINLGRGETVDEKALIDALQSKRIAGAGLDVFEREPLPEDNPLWGMENVVITPHVGGKSDVYSDQILPLLEENLHRYLKGERRNLINFIER